MDLREVQCEGVDWIQLVWIMIQFWAFVKME
jgi:hypothetical protein